ncbi:MAG: AbgT family transporter [Firmicutes bacterium]|nr:AbgT family transporter [Candidatus Colimorpha enterica]
MNKENAAGKFDSISIKSYISSIVIILCLMIATYVLTFILPAGQYVGEQYGVLEDVSFPFYKFILSPILVLGSDGNTLLIAILAFLLVIGGVFEALTKCNFMEYLLKKLVRRFYGKRYALIYVIVLFFMLLGSFVGTFEEVIPMIPFICALSVSLGFDNLVGLGISLLAAGGGFASGIMNPFTVGIAQKIAEVPLFSGVWIRILTFAAIYLLLTTFLTLHAKRIDRNKGSTVETYEIDFQKNEALDRAVIVFGTVLGLGLILCIMSTVITVLQDYTLIIIALCFLIGGISASLVAKMKPKELLKAFGKGASVVLPSLVLILFASSIKYILVESCRLDTLVYDLMKVADGLSPYMLILFIYLVVIITELFIASGSAKAFLLIPLILPIASAFDIPANMIVLAYIFGDGFANYIYPTDAALLISLNLSDYTYVRYIKDTWIYHLLTFAVTCGILLLGLAVGYR